MGFGKIKLLIMLLILSGLVDSIYSETRTAKSAFKSLKKRYNEIKTFEANFKEVFEWALTKENVVREGTMILDTGDKFKIETPEQLLVCDGKSIYRFNPVSNQLIIEPVDKEKDAQLPRRFLFEFGDEYNPSQISELLVEEQAGFRLDLIPKDHDKELLTGVSLWVTSDDLTIRRIKLTDINGNNTFYHLTSIHINIPISPQETTFTPPQNIEIFDLR